MILTVTGKLYKTVPRSPVDFTRFSSSLQKTFMDARDPADMILPVLSSLTLMIAEMPFRVDLPMLFQIGYVIAWVFAIANAFRPRVRFPGAWRVCAVVLTIGLSMLLGSRIFGSSLDERGVLHEPFALVALGSLIGLAGLGFAILLGLISLVSGIVARRAGR